MSTRVFNVVVENAKESQAKFAIMLTRLEKSLQTEGNQFLEHISCLEPVNLVPRSSNNRDWTENVVSVHIWL